MGTGKSAPPKPWEVDHFTCSYASTHMSLVPQEHTFAEMPVLEFLRLVAQTVGKWEVSCSIKEPWLHLERCHLNVMTKQQKKVVNTQICSVLSKWTHEVKGVDSHLGLPGPLWRDASMHRYWPETSGRHWHKGVPHQFYTRDQSYAGTLLIIFPLQKATADEKQGRKRFLERGGYSLGFQSKSGAVKCLNGFAHAIIHPPVTGVKMVLIPTGTVYAVYAPPAEKTLYILDVPLCFLNRDEDKQLHQTWMCGVTGCQFWEPDLSWHSLCCRGDKFVAAHLKGKKRFEQELRRNPNLKEIANIKHMHQLKETARQAEDRDAWDFAQNILV